MKISIVTIALNAAETIADTLQSVAAQNYGDFEHIIIDGASTDGTQDIIRERQHSRLRITSEPDNGLYDAMNKGLRAATGDVVGFLNADDFFVRPNALRLIAAAFSASGSDCVVGQTVVVDRQDIRRVRRLYPGRGFRPAMLRFGHMPPHPSFYARRDLLIRVGGFDTGFRISGDFDLMLKLFLQERSTLTAIDESLVGFRIGGVSANGLKAKLAINTEVSRALRTRGFASNSALLFGRYPLKALQFFGRPVDYPCYLSDMNLPTPPSELMQGR